MLIFAWGHILGWPIGYIWLAVFGWACFKEFVFDILIEQDSWSDSFEDFTWYMTGAAAGNLSLLPLHNS